MKKRVLVFAAVLSACLPLAAQNNAPSREYFRLDLVLKEMESGKLVNSRSFQLMTPSDDNGVSSIRSGAKVPVPGGAGGTTIYIDVGVNIDVRRLHRSNDELSLEISAEASTAENGSNVIRQAKWNSNVLIPVRKPVVVYSADGPTANRQMQLEITATPVR